MDEVKIMAVCIFVGAILLTFGCAANPNTQNPSTDNQNVQNNTAVIPAITGELKAIADCQTLLDSNWNAGFSCVLNLGNKVIDVQNCDKLEILKSSEGNLQDFKSICKIAVAAYKKDATLCPRITSFSDRQTEVARNTCFVQIAVATKNKGLCLQINSNAKNVTGSPEYGVCLAGVAKEAKDETICPKIENQTVKFGCITEVAVAKRDAQLCESIPENDPTSAKYLCVSWIAGIQKDWKLCQKLTNESNRNLCVKENAWSQLDVSICYNIATPSMGCESGQDDATKCTDAEKVFKQCRKAIEDFKQMCKTCDPSTGIICPKDCSKFA